MMKINTCAKCKFMTIYPGNSQNYCHKSPPTTIVIPAEQDMLGEMQPSQVITMFPQVNDDGWCSLFETKKSEIN